MKGETTKAQLRKYAWLMTGALSTIGALALIRGNHKSSIVFFSAAGLFLIFGLASPTVLGPVYRLWMGLAQVLAWINTRIILSLLYYVMLTPVSLIMKMIGRDALKRRVDRSRSSYWHPKGEMKPAKERYEHLY